ncbi:hypothetical protein [Desulfurobacterium sp.]|uniref:hypothetical protein n=1 Tax=Desulfurobacterium sp. TaxID=2004706 RepID=UPI0026129054|nr:hypothetical protein [Desulfurobacterium sp.]
MEVRWSKNWNNEYWIGVSYDKIKVDRPDITAYEIIGKWALMLDAIETIIKEYESGTDNLAKLGENNFYLTNSSYRRVQISIKQHQTI